MIASRSDDRAPARALPVHSRPQDQRHDLVTLLSLLDDPRAARTEITTKEIRARSRGCGWRLASLERAFWELDAAGEDFRREGQRSEHADLA